MRAWVRERPISSKQRRVTTIKTRAEGQELLALRIEQSGLSTKAFAKAVMKRDPRIIRRWLDMSQVIPQVVLNFLEAPEPCWPQEVDGNR